MSAPELLARRPTRAALALFVGLCAFAMLPAPSAQAEASGITRDEIIDTAAAFSEHIWECSLENYTNGVLCELAGKEPWTSDYEVGEIYMGLPYDWGGYRTLEQFEQDLIDGQGAGSHMRHGVTDCTTGLDCSGFVSQCWGIGHFSTSTMAAASYAIDPDDIERGDAWNHPGSHIVLWLRESESGAPVFYEATGDPVSRTRLNETATWSYLSGYTAIRPNVLGGAPGLSVGTSENPIKISSFPFSDDNNTALSDEAKLNGYSCAPDTREDGPEIYYQFSVEEVGTLELSVEDPLGVDVDVHLLSALDASACLARDDTDIRYPDLAPGTYWIIADTWTKADGTQLPGPYHLEARFLTGVIQPDSVDQSEAGSPEAVAELVPDALWDPGPWSDVGDSVEDGGGGGGGGGCTIAMFGGMVGFQEILLVLILAIGLAVVFRSWRG